jgi:hypothetical protein
MSNTISSLYFIINNSGAPVLIDPTTKSLRARRDGCANRLRQAYRHRISTNSRQIAAIPLPLTLPASFEHLRSMNALPPGSIGSGDFDQPELPID